MDLPVSSWFLALLALFYIVYKLGTWNYDRFTNLGLPFEKPLPFLGNMASFVTRKNSFGDIFLDVYNKHKGKSLVGFFQFLNPMVMVFDPDIIKMITVKDFDHFTDHVNPLTEEHDPLFGKVLFALTGDRWRQMRNTLSPAFTSAKMKAMCLLVTECGDQLGRHLEKKVEDAGGLLTLEMKDLYTRYANDVIATAGFGIHCDSLEQPQNEFYVMGKTATNFGGSQAMRFMGFMLVPTLMKVFNVKFIASNVNKFFYSLVTDTMAQREKEHIIRPDMIHLLMEARKGTLKSDSSETDVGDAKKKHEMTDEDITAQVFLFFLAGFDTASTHLCFLSHLLAVHPDMQRRLQQEIDDVLAADDGKLTYDGLSRLKYMDMCISEALRLWPPAVVTDRKCVKTYTIPATANSPRVTLNPGDSLALPVYALHRDAKFFPEPEKFDPERFSEERKREINPFAYIPFGVGPRVCIGQRFALMETKIALTSLLSRFDLEPTAQTPKKLVLNKKTFNMGVEGGFWLGIRKRANIM